MSFAIRNLSVLAYAQGFTLWHYRAGAARIAEIIAPGFFNAATDMFAVGDMVLISAIDGGTVVCVSTTDKNVNIAPMLTTEVAK